MTSFTHSLAILIGIDAYGHGIPSLTTPVNDATRLADVLRADHGYETILLTERAIAQPVTQMFLHSLFTQELPARLGGNDRLLVYPSLAMVWPLTATMARPAIWCPRMPAPAIPPACLP